MPHAVAPESLAVLHKRAFVTQRPWTAAEFSGLIDSPHCFVVAPVDHGATSPNAFALGRTIVDEAELLTLACDPNHRRQGLARTCLNLFHTTAAKRGATRAFLEVSADNAPAIALYLSAKYTISATRQAYYPRENGPAIDALMMSRTLA